MEASGPSSTTSVIKTASHDGLNWIYRDPKQVGNDGLARSTDSAQCRRGRRHRSRGAFPGKPVEPANQQDAEEREAEQAGGREAAAAAISSLVPAWPAPIDVYESVARNTSCLAGLPGLRSTHVRATPRSLWFVWLAEHSRQLKSNSMSRCEGLDKIWDSRCNFSLSSSPQDPAASTTGIIRCACRRCSGD